MSPYPAEHSCRIKNPDDFQPDSFRRIERGEGNNKISIIIGRPKGETTTTTQAYRYNKEIWTEARAREHCDGEGGTFEPASKEAKEKVMINLADIDTLAKAYAIHNKIHAEYVDARWGSRKKVDMQEDHEQIVRHILALGGHHISKGEVLDATLPEELRGTTKLRYVTDGIILSDTRPISSHIQIFRTGTFYHPQYGKFTITEDTLKNMIKNFTMGKPKPPTEMVVDFDHLSIENDEPMAGRAAGWIKKISNGGALFADVEWTDEAAELIRKKQFRFISPEWHMNYHDKESNKAIGPTLLSVALTNRPFLEGMAPVVLSDHLQSMIFSEESIDEHVTAIRQAFYSQFEKGIGIGQDYISEVYDTFVIIEHGGELFKLPYTRDDKTGKIIFDTANQIKVTLTKTYQELTLAGKKLAEWDTKYINDLPDNCFAYIRPGGEKDEDGRTVPRALRFLPYKKMNGEIDLPHLRNALARLPQTSLSPAEQAKARAVLVKAAQEAGVGDYEEKSKGGTKKLTEQELGELKELLGITEGDVLDAVRALKARAEQFSETEVQELRDKLAAETKRADALQTEKDKAEQETVVSKAIADKKLLPKMKDWALALIGKDRASFDSYIESAEPMGPEMGIRGRETGDKNIKLSETELTIAKKLGVSEESLMRAKEDEEVAK